MQRTTFVNEKMELTRSFTIKKEIGKEEYDLVINQINLDSELMNSEYEELLKIESEFTVVQKLNQGSFPKTGCNRFRGSFFVTFLGKQKSKSKKVIAKEQVKEQTKNNQQFNRVIKTILCST